MVRSIVSVSIVVLAVLQRVSADDRVSQSSAETAPNDDVARDRLPRRRTKQDEDKPARDPSSIGSSTLLETRNLQSDEQTSLKKTSQGLENNDRTLAQDEEVYSRSNSGEILATAQQQESPRGTLKTSSKNDDLLNSARDTSTSRDDPSSAGRRVLEESAAESEGQGDHSSSVVEVGRLDGNTAALKSDNEQASSHVERRTSRVADPTDKKEQSMQAESSPAENKKEALSSGVGGSSGLVADGLAYASSLMKNAGADGSSKSAAIEYDDKFMPAFGNSLGMIFATEIGDKTFFIAAVMAMSNPRLVVFAGAMSALAVMTVLSTILGHTLPHLLPKIMTHWMSIILFAYFGARMLLDAKGMYARGEGTGASEELEEVEHELVEKGLAGTPSADANVPGKAYELGQLTVDAEFGLDDGHMQKSPGPNPPAAKKSAREIVVQAFILTFLAEWGDRSQIATIALAAAQNPYGVTVGACLGHAICTGGAVIGGKLLASRITERQVALSGGILFFVFAFYSWYVGM